MIARENPGRSDETAVNWCPASPADGARTMDAAAQAFPAWAQTPLDQRADALTGLAEAIEHEAESFAALIVRENGKTRREARAEVQAGLKDARYLIEQARRDARPDRTSTADAAVHSEVRAEPVGVYLVITPWNFPLATILRKLFPALVYGNTVVVKPSELTPGPAHRLFERIVVSALPAGIAALVLGFGAEIGPTLLRHPALRGVSFTGSTASGLAIARATAGRDVRLQLEMGGKNTLVVLADAELEPAVEAAMVGGFSCAGQWCTGTGRVIVEAPIADKFCAELVERIEHLRLGPGDDPATGIGPVITAARVEATLGAITKAVASGARVRCGGGRATLPNGVRGHFLQPTLIDQVTEGMDVLVDELFAPVLPVAVARDREHALHLANTGNYGLSASVFSADAAAAETFAARIEAGMIHVNLHTAYREPALPVAGWRDSGRGVPECGRFAREFFTRPRAVYLRR